MVLNTIKRWGWVILREPKEGSFLKTLAVDDVIKTILARDLAANTLQLLKGLSLF